MRYYHRKDYEEEQDSVTLELELRKTVCDEAAHEHLQKRTNEGEQECITESGKVVVTCDNRLICVKCGVLGDQSYCYVYKVFRCHEGRSNLGEEREQNDVRYTNHQITVK